jgi:hypothetical protein
VRLELGETHALAGERIQGRRADFAAEGADVGIAQVVGEDDDDVGPARRLLGDRGHRRGQCRQPTEQPHGPQAERGGAGEILMAASFAINPEHCSATVSYMRINWKK